jgi:hypothetical protein
MTLRHSRAFLALCKHSSRSVESVVTVGLRRWTEVSVEKYLNSRHFQCNRISGIESRR